MNIARDKIYKDLITGKTMRVVDVVPESNLAICVNFEGQSAKLRSFELSELNDRATIRRWIPVEPEIDELPPDLQLGPAKEHGDKLVEAFAPLVELGPLALLHRKMFKDFRAIGLKIGMTAAGVNGAFTKVLQAGMRLQAVYPRWHKCGRSTFEIEGGKICARATKQPDSYPLSLKDFSNIEKGVLAFLHGETTWGEAHTKFLKKFYPAGIKIKNGVEIVAALPTLQRPSISQFRRHGRRMVGVAKLLELRCGKECFEANHLGKPIGQSATALMPGMEADIDWTTTGLVSVRRRNRLSIGTLVVYPIVDRYSGEILSMYLTMASASYSEASRAVLLCLEDKVELCRRYGVPIGPEDWPVKHLMVTLTGDRGELNSWTSSSLVTGLGIKMKMTRTRKGKDKGSVESVNGSIKRLLRRLSGGVWKYRRVQKDPQLDAIFDFDQVYRVLLAFTVKHNKRIRQRQPLTQGMLDANLHHAPTPNNIWAYAAERGMLREMELDRARIHVLPFETAAVTERGIEKEGLRFMVPDFDAKSPGGIAANEWLVEARKKRWKVELGIDSATVGHVWLRHAPRGFPPMLLLCRLAQGQEPYAELTWAQYRLEKAQATAAKKAYIEGPRSDDMAVFDAILDKTIAEASAATKSAVAGMPKSKRTNGAAQNRADEAKERVDEVRIDSNPSKTEEFRPYVPKLPRTGT